MRDATRRAVRTGALTNELRRVEADPGVVATLPLLSIPIRGGGIKMDVGAAVLLDIWSGEPTKVASSVPK